MLLLEETPLPESYSFLIDPKYSMCFSSGLALSQGETCNSCWAFATQKMAQARMCKWKADEGSQAPFINLSPFNLICKVQGDTEGIDVCDPKSLDLALDYATTYGILTYTYMWKWTWHPSTRAKLEDTEWELKAMKIEQEKLASLPLSKRFTGSPTFGILGEGDNANPSSSLRKFVRRSKITNVADPNKENCRLVLGSSSFTDNVVIVPGVVSTAPPFTADVLKRRLLRGPVIGTIRLTWEFLLHTAALFHPKREQTFCRIYKTGDPEDYCDPARRATWDQVQVQDIDLD
jgi:hypothetical protein